MPVVLPVYARYDLTFERGEGAYLFTTDGRRFLDFASGIAVTALGHAHPRLVKALTEQAQKLWHTSNLFHIPGQERVARKLVDASFADTVFFANSGAEANECAIKMARRFHQEQGSDRFRVIAAVNAFHGRTLATVAAGGQEKHLKSFAPMVEGFDRVPFGNLNEARNAVGPQTAAVLVEPVQGEGGIRPADKEYMKGLRRMCDEYGLLLILDEIQTGIGRTGKLFAYEWSDVEPDIVTSAKGLGGGFPVGACLAKERVAQYMAPGSHGTTFGGNPLAMAVADAVLETVLAEGFLESVNAVAARLRDGLEGIARKHPAVVEEVRGLGLLLGLKCGVPNTDLIKALIAEGLVTAPAGDNVVRLLPPLIVGEAEVAEALDKIDRACVAVQGGGR